MIFLIKLLRVYIYIIIHPISYKINSSLLYKMILFLINYPSSQNYTKYYNNNLEEYFNCTKENSMFSQLLTNQLYLFLHQSRLKLFNRVSNNSRNHRSIRISERKVRERKNDRKCYKPWDTRDVRVETDGQEINRTKGKWGWLKG